MIRDTAQGAPRVEIPADAIIETPDSIHAKSLVLAGMVEAHCQATGEAFDFMVVVPRGGYAAANVMSRALGFTAPYLLHMGIGSYGAGSSERESQFQLGQMPLEEEIAGKDLLVIDEVCDTGETLTYVEDYLRAAGAGLRRYAVLHHKPLRSTTNFKPDFFVEETDRWVVYPAEDCEEQGKQSVARRRTEDVVS